MPKTPVNVGDPSKLPIPGVSVDLRPSINEMGLAVRIQHPRGVCSVFATTFLLEYMVCKELKELKLKASTWQKNYPSVIFPDDYTKNRIDFSEEYLNWAAACGDGGNFIEMKNGYEKYGIVDEEWFPYKERFLDEPHEPGDELIAIGKQARYYVADYMVSLNEKQKIPNTNPPQYDSSMGFNDEQIAAIMRLLDNEVPVGLGYHGAAGSEGATDNPPKANPSIVTFGGLNIFDDLPYPYSNPYAHSVDIVGYTVASGVSSGGYFIIRSSWGSGVLYGGYALISFSWVRKFAYDAIVYHRPGKLGFIPKAAPGAPVYEQKFPEPSPSLIDKLGKLVNPDIHAPYH